MTATLIGSRALAHWFPEYKVHEDSDWDIITDDINELPAKYHYLDLEVHGTDFLVNGWFNNEYYSVPSYELGINVATPKALSIIKRSHLWRDLRFGKHITDYNKYLRYFSNMYDSFDRSLLELRTKLTMRAYPQQHPKLNQSVEEFFDDGVKKVYSHDWLHEQVAYHDKPLYTYLQKDPTSAWCNKDLWDGLNHKKKLECIAEEVHVICIERFMIPSNWKHYPKLGYNKALEKVCTTLCSGWFRDYAIDNFEELLTMYDKNKLDKVQSKILMGQAILN